MPLHRRRTRQQRKNRQTLLTQVREFWIKGVLANSLHKQVSIKLGLEESTDTVDFAWNLELATADEVPKPLPQETQIISVFEQLGEGGTLLILGEPGAGKTTSLLQLTRDLLDRAEQDLDYPIPVVFNLSSWAGRKQTMNDWLIKELQRMFLQFPPSTVRDWVKKQQLLLLLDGLDEVKAEHRESCVAALNDFQQNYASGMVVCSSLKDYSTLSNRLKFHSTIYIKPLTPEQINQYLNHIQADLTELKALMAEDRALQELAKSPLMLNMMVLAYQGVAVQYLPKTEVVEERRKQLFDDYIERMLEHPTYMKGKQRYSPAQTKYWLAYLAQRMVENSQTIFFIDEMHLWLQGKGKRVRYLLGGAVLTGLSLALGTWLLYGLLINGLIGGLLINGMPIGVLINGLLYWLMKALINGFLCGLSLGLMALIAQLIAPSSSIKFEQAFIQNPYRLMLYRNGYIPWNYLRFLDYAAERILLKNVGNSYLFIHRLLLEHFAQRKMENGEWRMENGE
ncbi:MAG: NACHT domain-containing protein [Symploca sp. SIO1B1]|nr:NACHT domain-containing protein [Symploca sp. SIO1B1]